MVYAVYCVQVYQFEIYHCHPHMISWNVLNYIQKKIICDYLIMQVAR